MALSPSVKLLHVVLLLFFSPCLTYTIYGTKRYGHVGGIPRLNKPSWNMPVPYQQFVRTERYPSNYEMYPSYTANQDYAEELYYPQDTSSYPLYYPPPRTSKYEVYQAVMPYYYGESPVVHPSAYGYYGYNRNGDPLEDIEEEMIQKTEREERERSQPIGQEILYENENDSEDNFDEVNAAFLQNLIMSQMYKDSLQGPKTYFEQNPNVDYYPDDSNERWEAIRDSLPGSQEGRQEDEDVKELRQLANSPRYAKQMNNKNISPEERYNWLRSESNMRNSGKDRKVEKSEEHPWQRKRNSVARKNAESSERSRSSTTTTTTESPPRKHIQGQEEEVLTRPTSTNWQNFISQTGTSVFTHKSDWKRTPSVYDTIKHMLDMEKQLENNYNSKNLKPPMRKRIVTSEDNLTQQLSVLKKSL